MYTVTIDSSENENRPAESYTDICGLNFLYAFCSLRFTLWYYKINIL